jgi:hypothetical protein
VAVWQCKKKFGVRFWPEINCLLLNTVGALGQDDISPSSLKQKNSQATRQFLLLLKKKYRP